MTATVAHSGRTGPAEGDGTPGSSTAESEAIPGAAIEAATAAVLEAGKSHAWSVIPHDDVEFTLRVAEPILRQAVAEEIATALQAMHDALAEDDVWENEGRAYLADAIKKAREIGATA